jgi:capsular polysaccharide biosynthesis protein
MFSNFIFLIIINICFSIIIIHGCHFSWNILKDTYSKRKTKDLVNTQIKKYQKMLDEIQCSQNTNINPLKQPSLDQIPKKEIERMNNELSDFILNDL